MEWINNEIEYQINIFYAAFLKRHPKFLYTAEIATLNLVNWLADQVCIWSVGLC